MSLATQDYIPQSLFSTASTANQKSPCYTRLYHAGFMNTEPSSDAYESELKSLREKFHKIDNLNHLLEGVCLEVVIPKISEDDPGSMLIDQVIPAIEKLKKDKEITFELKYISDHPIEYRITPTPNTGHSNLLNDLRSRDLPGWFIPINVGDKYEDIRDFAGSLPDFVSLIGFNDGLQIIIQHIEMFTSLCLNQRFWFSGVTSETSGVGFCLESDKFKNLLVRRMPYSAINNEDIHGLLVSHRQ